jgi:hypothetical protein
VPDRPPANAGQRDPMAIFIIPLSEKSIYIAEYNSYQTTCVKGNLSRKIPAESQGESIKK